MMKKLALLLVSILLLQGISRAEEYDPQNTMLALNMAVVSVHRIITTQSRAVLDDEYQNIINNLSLGNIRSDPEITELYEKLLDVAGRKKLRSEEAEYLRKNYDAAAKKSISGALSDFGKSSVAAIREDGSIGAFFGSFSTLLSVGAASYFKYQTGGVNLKGSLEDNLYRLKAEDLADFNELQKQLLSSSWNLMNKYSLPDEYRLVQRSMDDFSKAVDGDNEPAQKLRMLQALEDDFRVYAPYWYYRAKAAHDTGDEEEARVCLDVFDEVWRPVLRRDPYMLEAAKFRINDLVKDGLPYDEEKRQVLLGFCGIMRGNTMREDWVNNLFAGAVYYALDEKDEGIRCLSANIDFGYEEELSGAVLQYMRAGVPAVMLFSEALRLLKLNELTAGMSSPDRQRVFMIADCLDGKDGAPERLALVAKTPAELHALRVSLLRSPENFAEVSLLAENQPLSGDELSRDYAVILPALKVYSDDGNALAMVMLADMYLYGWGVDEYPELAKSLYFKAAEKGELYAQSMYVSMLILDRKREAVVEVPEPSADKKPQKDRKPLLRFWPFKRQ
ncbi:MAG: SEL1-like repeat protein [Synergistaceae bacterium]|nr:SEL1-like repeat protein [Synergistaceae bacterium]